MKHERVYDWGRLVKWKKSSFFSVISNAKTGPNS